MRQGRLVLKPGEGQLSKARANLCFSLLALLNQETTAWDKYEVSDMLTDILWTVINQIAVKKMFRFISYNLSVIVT